MKAKVQGDLFDAQIADITKLQRAAGLDVWRRRVLPAIATAVERVTPKECAELFDARPGGITDALAERDRKSPRAEWIVMLLIAAPEATKLELLTELCRIAGYAAPPKKKKLTQAERDRRRWEEAKRMAPGLVEVIDSLIDENEDEE